MAIVPLKALSAIYLVLSVPGGLALAQVKVRPAKEGDIEKLNSLALISKLSVNQVSGSKLTIKISSPMNRVPRWRRMYCRNLLILALPVRK